MEKQVGAESHHGGSGILGEVIWTSSVGNGQWETFEKFSTAA